MCPDVPISGIRIRQDCCKIENHSLDSAVQNCGSLAGTSTIATMAYFRNNTVNLLNLHYAIHSLALSGGGAFFLVFLLKSGVPVPAVLASIAAILLGSSGSTASSNARDPQLR